MPGIDALLVLLYSRPVGSFPPLAVFLMKVPDLEVGIVLAQVDRQRVRWKLDISMRLCHMADRWRDVLWCPVQPVGLCHWKRQAWLTL